MKDRSHSRITRLFLPLFIVFLMIFSVFGVFLDSFSNNADSIEKFEYKDYDFRFDGSRWFTFKDKQRIEFLYDPRVLDSIYIGGLFNKIFNYKKIYLSIDPEDDFFSEREFFRQTIGSLVKASVINSCPEDKLGCENLPIKDCKDSITNEVLIIKLERGNGGIQEDESCVAIIGDSEYLIRIIEKIRMEAIL